MTLPPWRQAACRTHVIGLRSRAPPVCRRLSPCPPVRASAGVIAKQPEHSSQEHQGLDKAEGKIKGGGTSLAWKAVCTGAGGDTAPG